MALTPSDLQRVVALSLSVPDEEIGCGDCGARLDRFAEMQLQGLDTGEALPLVEEHLRQCHECEDEFQALMEVLRAADREGAPWWQWFRALRRGR